MIKALDAVTLRRNTDAPTLITDIAKALFAGTAGATEMRAMLALPGLSDIAKFALGAKISFTKTNCACDLTAGPVRATWLLIALLQKHRK